MREPIQTGDAAAIVGADPLHGFTDEERALLPPGFTMSEYANTPLEPDDDIDDLFEEMLAEQADFDAFDSFISGVRGD